MINVTRFPCLMQSCLLQARFNGTVPLQAQLGDTELSLSLKLTYVGMHELSLAAELSLAFYLVFHGCAF